MSGQRTDSDHKLFRKTAAEYLAEHGVISQHTKQIIEDLKASVAEAPSHVLEFFTNDVWEGIKANWPKILAVTIGLVVAESVIGALTAAPEPTLITKVIAAILQILVIVIIGYFAAVETIGAFEEGVAWYRAARDANGNPESITKASRHFVRMVWHIVMAILAVAGVRARIKGFKIPSGGAAGEVGTGAEAGTGTGGEPLPDNVRPITSAKSYGGGQGSAQGSGPVARASDFDGSAARQLDPGPARQLDPGPAPSPKVAPPPTKPAPAPQAPAPTTQTGVAGKTAGVAGAAGSLATKKSDAAKKCTPTGLSREDAIPITWFKPQVDDYYPRSINIDGHEFSRDEETHLPHGEPIGVASANWPRIGKTFQLIPREEDPNDPERSRFREVLRGYGFDWTGLDADHVQDLQWDGLDTFNNLWPMSSDANRSAGGIQNQYQVVGVCTGPKGPYITRTIAELKRAGGYFGRWFRISKINRWRD